MQEETVTAIETKVDKKEYSDNELISVKTILNLPYYNSSKEFERAYGSIKIDGKDYEYVKRRVYHDTLELLCIPNHDKTKLQQAENDLAQANADGLASAPTKKSNTVVKICLPDFCQTINTYSVSLVDEATTNYFSSNTIFHSADYSLSQEHPPQVMHAILS